MKRVSSQGLLKGAIICLVCAAVRGGVTMQMYSLLSKEPGKHSNPNSMAAGSSDIVMTACLPLAVIVVGFVIGFVVCIAIHIAKDNAKRRLMRDGIKVYAKVTQASTHTTKGRYRGGLYTPSSSSVHAIFQYDDLSWKVTDIVDCNPADIIGKYFPVYLDQKNPEKCYIDFSADTMRESI